MRAIQAEVWRPSLLGSYRGDVLTGTEATLWAQISKQLSGVHRGGRRPIPANKDGTEDPAHQKEEKRKIPQCIEVKKRPFQNAPPSALINYLHVKYTVHTLSFSSLPALIVVVSLSRDLRTFLLKSQPLAVHTWTKVLFQWPLNRT